MVFAFAGDSTMTSFDISVFPPVPLPMPADGSPIYSINGDCFLWFYIGCRLIPALGRGDILPDFQHGQCRQHAGGGQTGFLYNCIDGFLSVMHGAPNCALLLGAFQPPQELFLSFSLGISCMDACFTGCSLRCMRLSVS